VSSCDVVHGNQQLALFNTHQDKRRVTTAYWMLLIVRAAIPKLKRWWAIVGLNH
jgi:hypothetical protein